MSSSSEGACISRSSSKQAVLLEQKGGEQVSIVSRSELAALDLWPRAFGHLRKDRRYFEIVEDTICPEFEYRYFAIRDQSGQVCTIQPFFVLDQDLLAGVGARAQALAGAVRRVWRFLANDLEPGRAVDMDHPERVVAPQGVAMAVRVKDGGESKCRALMARIRAATPTRKRADFLLVFRHERA